MLSEISMVIVPGAILICLKSIRNLVGVPFGIALDSKTESFQFPTRFKAQVVSMNILFIKWYVQWYALAKLNRKVQ